MLGPRARISPSAAICSSTPGIVGPTEPSLTASRVVDGQHRRGLGQAVALVDRHAGAPEELRHVAAQRARRPRRRRRSGRPGARGSCGRPACRRARASSPAAPAASRSCSRQASALRPTPTAQRKIFCLVRRALGDVLLHPRQHLLVDPRHRRRRRAASPRPGSAPPPAPTRRRRSSCRGRSRCSRRCARRSGRAAGTRARCSSPWIGEAARRAATTLEAMLPWVSITPLGLPVVPLV